MKVHIFFVVLIAAYAVAEDDGQYHPEPEKSSEPGYHWAEDGSYKLVPDKPKSEEEWKAEYGAYPAEVIEERPKHYYYRYEEPRAKPVYSYYRFEDPIISEEDPKWEEPSYRYEYRPEIRHKYYRYEPLAYRYRASYDPEHFYRTHGYYPKK